MLVAALSFGCRPARVSTAASTQLNVSVAPADSSESKTKTFQVTLSDPRGYQNLKDTRVLFSNAIDGRNACYVTYDPVAETFGLMNDAGDHTEKLRLNAGGVLENEQCRLDTSSSFVNGFGNDLTLQLAVSFKSGFGGKKSIYVYAENKQGDSTGLQPQGQVVVPKSFLKSTTQ